MKIQIFQFDPFHSTTHMHATQIQIDSAYQTLDFRNQNWYHLPNLSLDGSNVNMLKACIYICDV